MTSAAEPAFVETKQYRRFREFCDAVRRYQYIGLCYGRPGVGKTLSARYYASWDKVEAYDLFSPRPGVTLREVVGASTVFYRAESVSTPQRIEKDLSRLRDKLRAFLLEDIRREKDSRLLELRRYEQEPESYDYSNDNWRNVAAQKRETIDKSYADILRDHAIKHKNAGDPTTLIVIDEADRLRMGSLEQVRDIFDRGGIGLIMIGMPGIERRLSRYPQLYSRVGFVHEYKTLTALEVHELLREHWHLPGIVLSEGTPASAEVVTAIQRTTGGNFRTIHRLLTQIERVMEINQLERVTAQAVQVAAESLVIGAE